MARARKNSSIPFANREADFSSQVRRILAGRAGYRCSVPHCRRGTIGPGARSDQISNTGSGCHIYSSSQRGPRGTGQLSAHDRARPENGFWACATHARLIDINDGEKYPASLLLSWKAMHEAWIARENGDVFSPFGWIHEIVVEEAPVFAVPFTLRFAKVTLVVGGNGLGKTALCEWIAGSTDPDRLRRWQWGTKRLRYRTRFYSPTIHEVEMLVNSDRCRTVVDGREVPIQPVPMRVIYVPLVDRKHPKHKDLDDVAFVAASLGLREAEILNLLERVDRFKELGVSSLRVERRQKNSNEAVEPSELRRIEGNIEGQGFSDANWSHSEELRIVLALAVAAADSLSNYGPVLLVVDSRLDFLDSVWMERLSALFASDKIRFQALMTVLTARALPWRGWQIVQLRAGSEGTVIESRDA
jgi:hypothetical protein